MTAAYQPRSHRFSITAVARAELTMRMRDTSVPILLVLMAAVCVLLTPSADAGYAVITFGGIKPVMSASTSLVAAGVVLSLVMFPIYVLALGAGCSRDRRLGTGAALASSPIPAEALLAGRTIANAGIVILFPLVTLALVTASIASRTNTAPDMFAAAVYLLITVPCGLCALPARRAAGPLPGRPRQREGNGDDCAVVGAVGLRDHRVAGPVRVGVSEGERARGVGRGQYVGRNRSLARSGPGAVDDV